MYMPKAMCKGVVLYNRYELSYRPFAHIRKCVGLYVLIKHRGRNGNVVNSQELPKPTECRLQRAIVDRRIVRSGQQRNAEADEGHADMLPGESGTAVRAGSDFRKS